MNRILQLIIGALILIITIGFFGSWYWISSRSTPIEISASEKKIEIVDRNILRSAAVDELKKLDVNGQIPVTVGKDDIGKDNLFAR